MASIRPRTGANGAITYQVTWRDGGSRTGKQQSETFDPADGPDRDYNHADLFRAAVTAAGNRWPDNYLPGIGWVDAATMAAYEAAAAGAAEADAAKPVVFREFALDWVNSRSGIEPFTRSTYLGHIERHLNPFFGDTDITDTKALNAAAVGRWINELQAGDPQPADPPGFRRTPLAPKTIRDLHATLYSIIEEAVHAEPPLRATNPCARTKLPRLDDGEGDEEMVFLTPAEFATLHAALDEDARDLAEWLVGTGMRFHEATAVQVRDFEDLLGAEPAVRVRRSWKRRKGGAWYLGAPKTKAGRRRIGLTTRQVRMVLPLVAGKGANELLFTGPGGGQWQHTTFYMRRWRPAVYRCVRCASCRAADYEAGIGRGNGLGALTKEQITPCGCPGLLEKLPRIHDLRHTHVAWLIPTGAPLLAISRRLGHSSIKMTQDRYGHLLPEVDQHMVAGLEAVMAPLGAPARVAV